MLNPLFIKRFLLIFIGGMGVFFAVACFTLSVDSSFSVEEIVSHEPAAK